MFKSAIGIAALLLSQVAGAAAIINASSGLASPATTITFDEQVLAVNSLVTNEFSPQGVTFTPYLHYTPQSGYPNVTGKTLGNFPGANTPDPAIFTIGFVNVQTDAAFAMVSNSTSWTFEALLGGVTQESFTTTVDTSSNDFFGFTGITFDAIRVTSNAADFMLIDNLQLSVAGGQVPEPVSLALVAAALLGACGATRRSRS